MVRPRHEKALMHRTGVGQAHRALCAFLEVEQPPLLLQPLEFIGNLLFEARFCSLWTGRGRPESL